MQNIHAVMSEDHRACDVVLADLEKEVSAQKWESAAGLFRQFVHKMEQHLGSEEEVIFPSFEKATGMSAGPTAVMRMEHNEMRNLFKRMESALADKKHEDFLGHSETLMFLIQQHNAKEEQMLYRMADNILAASLEQILGQVDQYLKS